nr:dynein regulatory complex subunit 2 isoform X1 [Nothobranchius furzeri]
METDHKPAAAGWQREQRFQVVFFAGGRMPRKVVKRVEMTKEEQLLQLQQKLQADEELAKKKEETLQLFLKDKLQKEKRNTVMNQKKLDDGWRKGLRQLLENELHNDRAVHQQTSERKLDEQNSIIQRLGNSLQEAEHQEIQQQNCYLQHIEHLSARKDKWLKTRKQQREGSLQELQSARISNWMKMSDLQHRASLPLQTNSDQMSGPKDLQTLSSEELFRTLETDIKNLESTMLQNQEVHQHNLFQLDQMDQQFYNDQHQFNADMRKMKRDKRLQLTYQIYSGRMEQALIEPDPAFISTRRTGRWHEVTDQLVRDNQAMKKELIELSIKSDAVTKKLQAIISEGERALLADEMSPKVNVSTSPQVCMEAGPVKGLWEFEELQQDSNIALLHREVLRKQNLYLIQENKQLELLLSCGTADLTACSVMLQVTRAPTSTGCRQVLHSHGRSCPKPPVGPEETELGSKPHQII